MLSIIKTNKNSLTFVGLSLMRSATQISAALTLLVLPIVASAQPWTIRTIAGSPLQSGLVDGIGSTARFFGPQGIITAPSGDMFVTDNDNNAIRRLHRTGSEWVVTTIAGQWMAGFVDGTNTAAQFDNPAGIAIDTSSNLFVTDYLNHTIRRISPSGTNWIVTTIAGFPGSPGSIDGTNSGARFEYPLGITIDATGNLFVTDHLAHRIRKVSPVGTNWVVTTIAGSTFGSKDGTNFVARFAYPFNIVIDPSGKLFVSDRNSHLIRRISPEGTNWVVKTIAGLAFTSGTTDGSNNIARFNHPGGLAVDASGNLFCTDLDNHTIRRIALKGTNWVVTTLAGFPGSFGASDGTGTAARFYYPAAVTLDVSGNLYVGDYSGNTIRYGSFIPSLTSVSTGNHLLLSWPSAATNYVLETSAVLGGLASWSAVTNLATLNGENYWVTNSLNAPAGFFRLRK